MRSIASGRCFSVPVPLDDSSPGTILRKCIPAVSVCHERTSSSLRSIMQLHHHTRFEACMAHQRMGDRQPLDPEEDHMTGILWGQNLCWQEWVVLQVDTSGKLDPKTQSSSSTISIDADIYRKPHLARTLPALARGIRRQ
jgi:hypothetical protein